MSPLRFACTLARFVCIYQGIGGGRISRTSGWEAVEARYEDMWKVLEIAQIAPVDGGAHPTRGARAVRLQVLGHSGEGDGLGIPGVQACRHSTACTPARFQTRLVAEKGDGKALGLDVGIERAGVHTISGDIHPSPLSQLLL